MSAILSALQLDSVREQVLAETNGLPHTASRLSRLAEKPRLGDPPADPGLR
jgi:hypothetical protein